MIEARAWLAASLKRTYLWVSIYQCYAHFMEHIFYLFIGLSAHLYVELSSDLFPEFVRVLLADLLSVNVVNFVANETNHKLSNIDLVAHLVIPFLGGLETVEICKIINQEDALRALNVLLG